MDRARGRGHETNSSAKDEAGLKSRDGELLRQLNEQLHAMSQPMTVLLCAMEYGAGLETVQEMRDAVKMSQEACERLRRNVTAMQVVVRSAIEESVGDRYAVG